MSARLERAEQGSCSHLSIGGFRSVKAEVGVSFIILTQEDGWNRGVNGKEVSVGCQSGERTFHPGRETAGAKEQPRNGAVGSPAWASVRIFWRAHSNTDCLTSSVARASIDGVLEFALAATPMLLLLIWT